MATTDIQVQRILVGVDGSDDARHALGWAILLARQFQAEVVAVHAIGLLAQVGEEGIVPSHSHLAELQTAFETRWCAPLRDANVPYQPVLRDGAPVPVLLAVASTENIDLIVVGSRGSGGFPGLTLGSTSHQVTQHAACPVLVVPSDRL
jgi:nucleotide-binding universal stress UspA family protein